MPVIAQALPSLLTEHVRTMSNLNLHLKVWRQANGQAKGHFQDIQAQGIPDHASFLEMMDIVNERLITSGQDPVAFDHDCREGICGMCSMVINGRPHGPEKRTTTCQLHMRKFRDGDTIWIEPFRARAFPVVKDLMVDRSSFDRIQRAGGYIGVRTGAAVDANAIPVAKEVADAAMDAAECIGCGACVASCKNASAMLFVSAKAGQLNSLPQGQAEKTKRTLGMVRQMDAEGFGNCTNQYECEAACPKDISVDWISKLNRDFALSAAKDSVAARAVKAGEEGA
jgi:succinate dehydrogenase / fumarate reductase, iron-sulfur subunit